MALLLAANCGSKKEDGGQTSTLIGPNEPTPGEVYARDWDVAMSGNYPTASFGNTVVSGWDNYNQHVQESGVSIDDVEYLTINVSGVEDSSIVHIFDLLIPLGSTYMLRFSRHYDYVFSSCTPDDRKLQHIGIALQVKGLPGGSNEVFNVHVALWTENSRLCVAIYESSSGFCRRICSPTYDQIRLALIAAMVGIGIANSTAEIISPIATPVITTVILFSF